MRKVSINIVLVVVFILLLGVTILPFAAEVQFDQAKKLEESYRWKRAGEKYQIALYLNPLNAEYFAEAGDFLMRRSRYRKDKVLFFERAKRLYERALKLNPRHAKHWYCLGQAELAHSSSLIVDSQKFKEQSLRFIAEAIENFKRAIEKDPYNFQVNYFIGHNLLAVWSFLNVPEKSFAVERLKFVLQVKPWYGDFIYQSIMYYTEDFNLAEKVTPDNLEGSEALLYFIEDNNSLWQYREEAVKRLYLYRQKNKYEE